MTPHAGGPNRLVLVTVGVADPPGLLNRAGWLALGEGPVAVLGLPGWAQALDADGVPASDHGDDAIPAAGRVLANSAHPALGGRASAAVDGSWRGAGHALVVADAVVRRLRRDCPWDREQTHASLRRYLLEETYEAYDALSDGDMPALREELGDVLFQVLFHAAISSEQFDGWTTDEVAGDLAAKLIRRHPHVFGDVVADSAADVEANWDAIKRGEKQRPSLFDGVPATYPALVLAATLRRKAVRAGIPADLMPAGPRPGERLFTEASDDAEDVLRSVCREFSDAVRFAEDAARSAGRDPADLDGTGWRRFWPAGFSLSAATE